MTGIPKFLTSVKPGSALGGFLAKDAPTMFPWLAKLPETEVDRSVLTKIYGVPVGFQFGTAMGMDGWVADVFDIASDPITWGTGGLTNAGKAAKALRGIAGSAPVSSSLKKAVLALAKQGKGHKEIMSVLGQTAKAQSRLDTVELKGLMSWLDGFDDTKKATKALTAKRGTDRAARLKALHDPNVPGKERLTQITRDPTLERLDKALRADGITGGKAMLERELANRVALKAAGTAMKGSNDITALRKWEKEVRKLDASPRTQVLFQQNKRNVDALVTETLAGRPVVPLERGIGDQVRAGQRALLSARVPFTSIETPLIRGAPVIEGAEKLVRKVKGLGPNAPLFPGKRGAGLVTGAREATRAMDKILKTPRPLSDVDTVHEAAIYASETVKALPLGAGDFKDTTEVWTAETIRSQVAAGMLSSELKAAMKGAKINQPEDWEKVINLVDSPGKWINQPGTDKVVAMALDGKGSMAEGQYGLTAVYGNLTDAAKKAGYNEKHVMFAESLDAAFRKSYNVLREEGAVEAFKFHYFPRSVAHIKDEAKFAARVGRGSAKTRTSTFYVHNQPRVIEDLDELRKMEKEGILELEKDPAVIIKRYFEAAGQTSANRRYLQNTRTARNEIPLTEGMDAKVQETLESMGGVPIMVNPATKLVNPNTPMGSYLRQFYEPVRDQGVVNLALQMSEHPGRSGKIRNLVDKGETLVLKSVARQVKQIMAPAVPTQKGLKNVGEGAFEAGLRVNAVMKRGLLSFSMFHHMALTESAIADLGLPFITNMKNFVKEGVLKVARDQKSIFEAEDIIDTAVTHGLQLGHILDPEIDVFQRGLKWAERKMPALSKPLQALGKAEMVNNKFLWDYYHNSMKIFAFETLYSRGLLRHPNMPAKEVARGVSEHINNAFGGQVWENFWIGKTGQRMARLFLLAPDWTASNLRIAQDIYANKFKKHMPQFASMNGFFPISTRDVMRADVRATFARQYAMRAGLISVVGANIANFALSGHFMDHNAEERKTQIDLGQTDKNGRKLYLRFGKQFREPFELLDMFDDPMGGPMNFIKRKMSPVFNATTTQVFGRDSYGHPIVSAKDGPLANSANRLGAVAGGAVPISIQQMTGMGGRSSSRSFLQAAAGAMGLPIKTAFEVSRDPVDSTSELDRPEFIMPNEELFGDLTDERQKNGDPASRLMAIPNDLSTLPVFTGR